MYYEGGMLGGNSRTGLQNDPFQQSSPIYGQTSQRNHPQTDNFMEMSGKSRDFMQRDDAKKSSTATQSLIDKQVAQKRRSIENKNSGSSNYRQTEQFQPRGQAYNQPKSALSNYPNQNQNAQQQQQQVKQINKNQKVERDPVMDPLQQQQLFNQKRTLAKSQSQNRLLLVSPDTLLNKNNPYGDTELGNNLGASQDKNSFIKDHPSSRLSSHQHQDPMYKQHMQYSSGGPQGAHHNKAWQLKASNQNLLLSRLSTNNCTFCNKTHGNGMHSHSTLPQHCSAIYCSKDQQGFMIQNNLSKKYSTNRDYYNLKIVNDLIYNENTHIVSIFKDYLILDDINEFLKRYYTQPETKVRLPKLCSFYDKYSQVFPNYVVLPESKYMFKNIQRKQKLIDEQYQLQEQLANKQHQTLLDEDKLFNTKFYNSYYSMMGGPADMSMSKKQYEDQAKQIATQAGRKQPVRAIDQMRIDELVDRFLLKDSESNIQLITTAGLDFSGFTQQNSTILNNDSKTPAVKSSQPIITPQTTKLSTAASNNKQVVQQLQQNKGSTISSNRNPSTTSNQQKKKVPSNGGNIPMATTQNALNNIQANLNQKKQKNSFNNQPANSGKNVGTYPASTNQKIENLKLATMNASANNNNASGSTKTTPRLHKGGNGYVQNQNTVPTEQDKNVIQTSPATKEALSSYLQCQIDPITGQQMTSMESPNLKSPGIQGLKQQGIIPNSSQSSLFAHQQNQLANSLSQGTLNNRQNIKSQQTLLVPHTIQTAAASLNQAAGITNLKKQSNRFSNGSTKQQPMNNNKNKNVSPAPPTNIIGQQTQSQYNTGSRNQQFVNNSTQKSAKSINSHAKYLSGGNDQYQKLLANIGGSHIQQQQQQQNSYMTHYETMNSGLVHSSSKKQPQLHGQKSKPDLIMDTFQSKQAVQINQPVEDIAVDIVTGEDCDDCGIADERFASPDANKIVFSTLDEVNQFGRKSVEGVTVTNSQQLLLSSSEDKILSQCNNYDQIKKHLEQYITLNQHQQQTFDNQSLASNSKKYSTTLQTVDELKQSITGYNRDQMAQSAHSQVQSSSDQNNSRNGQQQKHFESLKQKIRGVFEQPDPPTIQSANKTPNKSSTHSKQSNLVTTSQNLALLQQNRMSLESKEHLMMMVGPNSGIGCQSSTAANQRQLSFSQNQINGQNNYRSITNIQQRKNSNNTIKPQLESSLENKRLSGQTRQSFKDMQQSQQQSSQEQQKLMKRCVTGKTLSINEINQQTFGNIQTQSYLQQASSTTTLTNPTFIPSQNKTNTSQPHFQNTLATIQNPSFNHQQVQQAANTVRVMTPSYSLASLSKIISPTTQASPMTMTVSLGNNSGGGQTIQSRKQLSNTGSVQSSKAKQSLGSLQQTHHSMNQQPMHSTLAQSQNFILADKNSKMISAKSNNSQKAKMSGTLNIQTTTTNSQAQKLARGQHSGQSTTLAQSNSMQNFQSTPRGVLGASVQQTQQEILNRKAQPPLQMNPKQQDHSNLSCTVSTENNSSKSYQLINTAAKAIESKNPKFMRTIEETGNLSSSSGPTYNTMLSASLGHRKSGTGLTMSVSQAQFDLKQKQKIQTVVNSNPTSIKRSTNSQQTLTQSASVSQFKSPSQQIQQQKKQSQNRYGNM